MSGAGWLRVFGSALILSGLALLVYQADLGLDAISSLDLTFEELLPLETMDWRYENLGDIQLSENLPGYRLDTRWSAVLPWGKSGRVRLALIPLAPDGQLDPVGQQVIEQFGSDAPIFQARLEAPGVRVLPNGEISQPWSFNREARFTWEIYPARTGRYEGTVWLHMRLPSADQGQDDRRLIAALPIVLNSRALLGLDYTQSYLVAGVGILVGVVLLAAPRIRKR